MKKVVLKQKTFRHIFWGHTLLRTHKLPTNGRRMSWATEVWLTGGYSHIASTLAD